MTNHTDKRSVSTDALETLGKIIGFAGADWVNGKVDGVPTLFVV